MFEKLSLKRIYRTKKDDVLNDLIVPVLARSTKYDRGTGYFSMHGLTELADGIIPYIKNGGKIRIITSVDLNIEDLNLIRNGYFTAQQLSEEKILEEIKTSLEEESLSLDLITNLIAAKIIEIKVAYLENGIFHEKTGYFEDEKGNMLWYAGSPNETFGGYRKNSESIMILCSWQDEHSVYEINEQKEYFNALWNNHDEEVRVFDFPEAAKNELFSKYKNSSDYNEVIKKIEESFINAGENKKSLYEYQEKAIEEFVDNGYRHFFEMATGTGKTFTAIKAIEKMRDNTVCDSLYTIVIVPQVDLQIQWEREFKNIGITPYLFGGNNKGTDWNSEWRESVIEYFQDEKIVVGISTYDTFFGHVLDQLILKKMNVLLVVDEAHELSKNQMTKLKKYNYAIAYRLGLSATPEKHSKTETEEILKYFTNDTMKTFQYTIEEAINAGFLSRYKYYPLFVHMDNDEFMSYQKYTQQLIYEQNKDKPDEARIQEILNNRSLIIKKASQKLDKLKEIVVDEDYSFINAVVYCGAGKDSTTEEKIIDLVTNCLHENGAYRVSQFTSNTVDRPRVLAEFEAGYYDTLVAIKCFDQGVDVPKLDKIYIMASDALLRQTIQRRGRVLRKCKETNKQLAYIYDMVVLPPEGIYSGMGVSGIMKSETKRVLEYARLAENSASVISNYESIMAAYDIGEDDFDEEND